ncbi:UPF0179 family protein [Methanoplanus sp. FWC-SCC4]|uniref:UPF0179 protein F1737_03650 n=1 Tax=Methanochimaera problematica TaxID=2609417 RepID=A0AA97I2Q4_9EURY|nr:UPF0179 family protein [Methanoplanus sp. FWC-SCC4]WOF15853.1 UPF0179 family protein [Methanoplanus sp. FWC-SCC4]
MGEDLIKITLIGKALARTGLEFIYKGELPECEGCRMHKVCNNLEPKKRYKIVALRGQNVHSCNVHHEGVCAVEVIESPVNALIDAKKAILNSEITFEQVCTEHACDNYDLCFPEGIIENKRYLISKINDETEIICVKGRTLKKVELTPSTRQII